MSRRRSGPISARARFLLGAAIASAACSKEPAPPSGPPPIEVQTAREIAAALFAEGDQLEEALAALEPLTAREPLDPEDLLRCAVVEIELARPEAALGRLERARELGVRSARLHYLAALVAFRAGELEAAERDLAQAAELAPEDVPTQLLLAACRMDLGEGDAEGPLNQVRALGAERGGSWYATALYRLNRLCLQSGRSDEALALRTEFSRLQERGIAAVTPTELERGNFGRLEFPRPSPVARAAPAPPSFEPPRLVAAELAGAVALLAVDLLDDGKIERKEDVAIGWSIGGLDVVGFGPGGVVAASPGAGGAWTSRRLWGEPVVALVPFDFGQDGRLDFWAVSTTGVALLIERDGALAKSGVELPSLPAPPSDLRVVDFDHEGDLDLLLVGPFGARLWRDDGAARGGLFADATAESGLARVGPLQWCVVEDLDVDQDVDFLLGGTAGVVLADSQRGGRFEARSDRVVAPPAAGPPVVADLDGDSRPDLWWGDAGGTVLLGTSSGAFRSEPGRARAPRNGRAASAGDVNGDGELDLVCCDASGARVLLSLGSPFQTEASLVAEATTAAVLVAQSGTALPQLARLTARGLEVSAPAAGAATALRLSLLGRKDNRRGAGAVVEIRARASYQRIFWSGQPQLVALAGASRADWIRVTWPNGVVQSETSIAAGGDRIVEQAEGLVGSCPFLYAWNGTTFGFVTDVLGVTPLGLPMRPGELVPPDHDEFVLVRGDALVPRDGRLELQLTEELREVTYLDRVRLDVVDHPAEAEIHPNERFSFPPFPVPRVHALVAPIAPRRVRGSDGRDWTEELRAEDQRLAAPFTPYAGAAAGGGASSGQFLGLAPPHFLELEFDPDALPAIGPLRLLLTGWFYWTDASVNVAAARTPDVAFVPPGLEVPDGRGGWRPAGPPIGFPAGKLKCMVIDVSDVLIRADPRLRVATTLRLYWDSIRLAADAGAVPMQVTPLEPVSARLWSRGFSEPRELAPGTGLEWFDWDRLSDTPRWNQHPGLYTRLGEVSELLGAADDRFVVMGSGDALTLHFPAEALPPLPAGWSRDYLLYLDGWAKDRDPNTVEALQVEPLPFHGMSAYPYRASERFPDDALHREWLLHWQTRPARRWIEPLTGGPAHPGFDRARSTSTPSR